ncbi:MAG: alpha/beta hydrolase [Acidobacteriota bacterium]
MTKTMLKWIVPVGAILGLLWGGAMLFEKSLIFFPMPDPSPIQSGGTVAGCSFADHMFSTEDGVSLHSRWFRPESPADVDPAARKVVLFFHGNAGNLSGRTELMVRLSGLGVEVLIIDYRGYGHSEGRVSEVGVYRDARAAWDFLNVEHGVAANRIVVFGKSLGGAVAIDLATNVEPAGLIVQSSFTSVPAMAARHYPFVPAFALHTKMDSLSKISSIDCPKLLIHSTHDEIVPFEMGRRLFEAAGPPKTFYEVVGAGHNQMLAAGGPAYLEAIGDFLDTLPD